ncbi:TMEM165/GDT1 family protein [Frankia sp. AgKG'84/4]|uniref:TMEM165/GDT1 family protein n=1 Tax=Frankia sp. AgKG'84/4 TaxID=573490 RepID=UPI00200FBD77|nr:TMEM165/GDT1 family protein [Frankia sp. AgKG'84/4]MCL9795815.1 TMEM165/GDT1 family protein [Frankia sp. AgKG'84/4]
MNITAVLVTFGVIFLAELPDKTMVASLVLGSRFRPLYVWVGVAAAFAVHVTLAVAAGSVFSLLPSRIVDSITALLFVVGAFLVLREGRESEANGDGHDEAVTPASAAVDHSGEHGGEPASPALREVGDANHQGTPAGPAAPAAFWRVAATSFGVVFLAELGDLTQISTANLAARFDSPVMVWIGAVLGLWTVAALAIAGGRGLLRVLPISVITRVAAAAFVVLAVLSAIEAVRG